MTFAVFSQCFASSVLLSFAGKIKANSDLDRTVLATIGFSLKLLVRCGTQFSFTNYWF